jgi:guanosine-3',5'-bis(diphosphate) 3'-pyrophosphohydrolase
MTEDVVYTPEQEATLERTDIEFCQLVAAWKAAAHKDDASIIERAYAMAKDAHRNQFRATGEPYIIHPMAATKILLELGLVDEYTLCAPRCCTTPSKIRTSPCWTILTKTCGKATVADARRRRHEDQQDRGFRIPSREEMQVQTLRKMFLAMSQRHPGRLRSKLADRLHNMRTVMALQGGPPQVFDGARDARHLRAARQRDWA